MSNRKTYIFKVFTIFNNGRFQKKFVVWIFNVYDSFRAAFLTENIYGKYSLYRFRNLPWHWPKTEVLVTIEVIVIQQFPWQIIDQAKWFKWNKVYPVCCNFFCICNRTILFLQIICTTVTVRPPSEGLNELTKLWTRNEQDEIIKHKWSKILSL